ncbi:MAG: hypothetical protein HYT37_01860 [Candidatus Sungbacteria bacterium]|nr:hypothetical protein [Candidatus Sungbacteria bacterium]
MKKIYISAFIFFGFLLQLLMHGLLEIWYINLLLADFGRYGFGLEWDQWELLHNVFTLVFLVGGLWMGYSQGKYWWRRIYEPIPWFRPLQKINSTSYTR